MIFFFPRRILRRGRRKAGNESGETRLLCRESLSGIPPPWLLSPPLLKGRSRPGGTALFVHLCLDVVVLSPRLRVCVCVRARLCVNVRSSAVRTAGYCSHGDSRHIGGSVRDIGTNKPQSGSAETDAGAIPTPRRWLAFVWLTGIGGTGKTWLDAAYVMQSMSRRGYFPHGGGALLGTRAAAALCCLLHAAIVPRPRACAF